MIPKDPLPGHELLVEHLLVMLKATLMFEYHDFKSHETAPKISLCNDLAAIMYQAQRGEYDNECDDEDKVNMESIIHSTGMPQGMKDLLLSKIHNH